MIRVSVIRFLQRHPFILDFAGCVYSIFHRSNPFIFFKKGIHCGGAFLNHVKIDFSGKGSSLYIGPRSVLNHCHITVTGNNAHVSITGGSTVLNGVQILVRDDGGKILIGSSFTMEGGIIEAMEGKEIIIGDDCMFSGGIDIITGDYHVITKLGTDERVNDARSISIGNHVWLSGGVSVLKGSSISDNCVVGKGAIVSGSLSESNAVYAGIPAKKIKDGIDWRRDRTL